MQDERIAADLHRVAGVVTALVTDDNVESFGKQIDDLAFAFITPLAPMTAITIELID